MYLLMSTNSFSKDMKVQSCCLSANELLYLIVLLWMLEQQTLLVLILERLHAKFSYFLNSPRCKRYSNVILMHLIVSPNLIPFAFVIFHCWILNLQSTNRLFSTISTLCEQARFSDYIVSCWRYFSCWRVGRTTLSVKDTRPILFVNFKTVEMRKEILTSQNYLFHLFHC